MNKLMASMSKFSISSYEVGSQKWVRVTHIENPEDFYARPVACDKILAELERPDKNTVLQASDVDFGSQVIFKSRKLRHYVRGEVQFVGKNNTYTLLAIDYGFMESEVKLKRIWNAHSESPGSIIPLAVNCQLADCKPPRGDWTEESIADMEHFINKEICKMTVRGLQNDKLIVELRNSVDDIATIMAHMHCSLLGYDQNSVSRLVTPQEVKVYVSYKNLKVDDVLRVRVLSGKSLKEFFVADVRDFAEYMRGSTEFINDVRVSRQLTLPEFQVGTPVAALISMEYERAVIKEITVPENKAKVQLLDWGTTKELDIMLMKQLSEHYCTLPAKAIYCSAEENQTWDNGLEKFLYPGYEFSITIKKAGHKFDVPNIVNLTHANM